MALDATPAAHAVPERRLPITGMQVGTRLMEIFGIESPTRFVITVGLDAPVTVQVTFYPTKAEMEQVTDLLRTYHLVPAAMTEPETVHDRYEYGVRLLEETGIPIRRLLAQAGLDGPFPPASR